MAISSNQLRSSIHEVLAKAPIKLDNPQAIDLLMGTAAQESLLGYYLEQLSGPAKSLFQIEPDTAKWLEEVYPWVKDFRDDNTIEWALEFHLDYAIMMCRLRYHVIKSPIPTTLQGQAEYWKKYYNTPLGAGTVEEYISNYKKYVQT